MLTFPTQFALVRQRIPSLRQRRERREAQRRTDRWRLHARLRWLRSYLASFTVVELARRAWRELGDDHAIDLAASIAYYSILSLFPLAIGLVSLFSLVLESDSVQEDVYQFFHAYLPGSHALLAANIEAVGNIRGILGILSLLGILWSSTLLFGAISRAVNRAWDIEHDRPFYIEKPRHILMALSLAPLFLASVSLTAGLQVLGSEEIPVLGGFSFLEHNGINALARPLPFLFSFVIFLLIYKFTPMVKTHWRYIWPGALVAALLFEIAKSVFVFYLENYAAYERIYGTLGSAIVSLAWAYVSGFIVVIGAEVSSENFRMRMGAVRGRPVHPSQEEKVGKATSLTRTPTPRPSPLAIIDPCSDSLAA